MTVATVALLRLHAGTGAGFRCWRWCWRVRSDGADDNASAKRSDGGLPLQGAHPADFRFEARGIYLELQGPASFTVDGLQRFRDHK